MLLERAKQNRSGLYFAALFCFLFLAVFLFGGLRASAAGEQKKVTCPAELYSGPGEVYSTLSLLPAGTEVTLLGSAGSEWVQVKLSSGKTGYVRSAYLEDGASQPETVKITGTTLTYLRVRLGPSPAFRSILTMRPGIMVPVVDNSNPLWAKIKLSENVLGYCSKNTDYFAIEKTSLPPDSGVIDSETVMLTVYYGKTRVFANVYSGPGVSYPVVDTLSGGTNVDITEVINPFWVKVALSGEKTGYCSTVFLNVESTQTIGYAELRFGNTGAAVTKLQNRLRALGYLTVGADGIFGNATLSALKTFQTVAGLPATGVATNEVLFALYDAQAPENPSEQPEIYTALSQGMQNNSVRLLQKRLQTLCYFTDRISGSYENTTALAVRDFQKAAGLSVTGTADVETQKRLYASDAPENKLEALVFATVLNVRSGPGTDYPVITQLFESTPVEVIRFENADWYEIRFVSGGKKQTGYASREWVFVMASNVWLDRESLTLKLGAAQKLTASVTTGLTKDKTVKWSTSNPKVATVSLDGTVTAAGVGTATITAAAQDGTNRTAALSVTVTGAAPSFNSISLSHTSGTIPQGKTLYIQAFTQPSGKTVYWSTSNPAVATVKNGYILGVGKGTANIIACDASGLCTAVCKVTVTEAEPVRFAYTTPNIISLGNTVTLVAITDRTRDGVRFVIDLGDGVTQTVDASSKTENGDTYVWKGAVSLNRSGTFRVRAYSSQSGVMSTAYQETSAFVTKSLDMTTTTLEERRASDSVIAFIADREGFISEAYNDPLLSSVVPTIGYGITFLAGDLIYNNITEEEAKALLVQKVNHGTYTAEVNKFLLNNNIRFNQQQFDAMVSFSYNIGAYYWNNPAAAFDVRDDMLSAYAPSTENLTAVTTTALYLRQGAGTSFRIITLMPQGTKLRVLETKTSAAGWYRVQMEDGTTGYCSATYLRLSGGETVRDLNYVNTNALINDMSAWHHAGNTCYWGLLYRRFDELEMFLYGDYAPDGKLNKYHFPIPSCIQN